MVIVSEGCDEHYDSTAVKQCLAHKAWLIKQRESRGVYRNLTQIAELER